MTKAKQQEIHWLPDAEEHDYPAAASYLSIIYIEERVAGLVMRLRDAAVVTFKAKDLFRASQLSPLGVSNYHVNKDWKKIRKGVSLSPLLLVRDEGLGKVVIADGYHRLCALYEANEDALVHCKIV